MKRVPTGLVSLNLPATTTNISSSSSPTRMMIDCVKPFFLTFSGSPYSRTFRTTGKPRPNRMSKLLEPSALETAMSPSPYLATTTEEKKSGKLVPAASSVKPSSAGLSFQYCPIDSAVRIMQKVSTESQTVDSSSVAA
eukprot:CAMPEP_0194599042 /NCGR_PEP_ID=MMETSP0292-20121207/27383_1 /TAXON_ID=39354 /ORGANISM="Heterosigma akashiwo, Strain CCMP2393" /LENGTH=137 /DNA_ID=CAMNT_0039460147 /DNA_START=214 /DNA_END=627 /DNA_ORIENTATION=+